MAETKSVNSVKDLLHSTGPEARAARRKLKRKENKNAKQPMLAAAEPAQSLATSHLLGTNVSGHSSLLSTACKQCHLQDSPSISGTDIPLPISDISDTPFPMQVKHRWREVGFDMPTPIQQRVWPLVVSGRDCLAVATTGSGKTLAFMLPIISHICSVNGVGKGPPTALALAPTRELVLQISAEAPKFGGQLGIRAVAVYGGAARGPQLQALQSPVDIVVATPGRLMDFLALHTNMEAASCVESLKAAQILVLDEADRMLDMGFEMDIRKIVAVLLHRRQTMLFTATWPQEMQSIASELLNDAVHIRIAPSSAGTLPAAADSVRQTVRIIRHVEAKWPALLGLLLHQVGEGDRALVFCNTKQLAAELTQCLWQEGYCVVTIHGDKEQTERETALQAFKTGESPILVATDVAARGLHIDQVQHVINYDFPLNIQDYVHRIGRTGRAGALGIATTYFTPSVDFRHARALVGVLRSSHQDVPKELVKLMDDKKRKAFSQKQYEQFRQNSNNTEFIMAE